jgi:hypothetical protein
LVNGILIFWSLLPGAGARRRGSKAQYFAKSEPVQTSHAVRAAGNAGEGRERGLGVIQGDFGSVIPPILGGMVELSGIEPLASSLRTRRSPN